MVLLPGQTLAQRQVGEPWERVVSDYMIGDLTVRTRATVRSWSGSRPWVRIFLVEPGMTIPYSIGEQTGRPAQPEYQRSLFRTVCLRIYLREASTRLSIAWKP